MVKASPNGRFICGLPTLVTSSHIQSHLISHYQFLRSSLTAETFGFWRTKKFKRTRRTRHGTSQLVGKHPPVWLNMLINTPVWSKGTETIEGCQNVPKSQLLTLSLEMTSDILFRSFGPTVFAIAANFSNWRSSQRSFSGETNADNWQRTFQPL